MLMVLLFAFSVSKPTWYSELRLNINNYRDI